MIIYHNKALGITSSGEVQIGYPAETGAKLNVASSSIASAIEIGRVSGQPTITSKTGSLILDSASAHVGISHMSDKDVWLAVGGGNVGIGTVSPQNITANSDLTIEGTIVNDDWVNATLLGTWVNYLVGYAPCGYFRDKNGIVYLRGIVKNGTISTDIANLPVGYRPALRKMFVALSYGMVIPGRIDIEANGDVWAVYGDNRWMSCDHIMFKAAGY